MYTIHADRNASFILVQYEGWIDVAERERALDEVRPMLHATGVRKVLVDFCRAKCAVDDFAQCRRLAGRLAADSMLRRCRIAYVTDRTSRLNPVVDALSGARGMAFERFPDCARAIEWLAA